MWLEEMILDGFKSYAQATRVFPFDPSFTAVTGLNGSGKSNILDAICFVLGITSLSRIRVAQLTDLIYKQGQAGVTRATVTLIFNNLDKQKSPAGYENIDKLHITRQIFSNGTTKYMLNDQIIKQKTLKQLFLSTGLNINNPNFLIMQGRIQAILNMKPQELLSILEETAGTLMYDQNKKDAEKTFDSKEMRLNQIRKTINEDIKPKIEQLEKERQIGVKICQIQKGLKGFDIIQQISQIFTEIDDIQQTQNLQVKSQEQEKKLREQLLQNEQVYQQKQQLFSQVVIQDVDQQVVKQYDEKVQQLAVFEQNIQQLVIKQNELNQQNSKKDDQIKKLSKKKDDLNKKLININQNQIQSQMKQLKDDIEMKYQLKQQLEQQIDLIKTGSIDQSYLITQLKLINVNDEEIINQLTQQLFKNNENISLLELINRINQFIIHQQNYLQQTNQDQQQQNNELTQLNTQIIDAKQEERSIEQQINLSKKRIDQIINQLFQLNTQFNQDIADNILGQQLSNQVQQIQNADNTNYIELVKQIIDKMRQKQQILKQDILQLNNSKVKIQQNYKSQKSKLYQQFVDSCNNKQGPQIINMINQIPQQQQIEYGLLGTVLDYVQIDTNTLQKYMKQNGINPNQLTQITSSIENLISGRYFNLIFKEIKQASQFMKSQYCKTRCTALPIDNIEAYPLQQSRVSKVHQYKGLMISEVVKPSNPQLQKIFDSLFDNQAICPTLQEAKQIAYDEECKFLTVTFDGDTVDPHGIVSGGSRFKPQNDCSTQQFYQEYVKYDLESQQLQLNFELQVNEQLSQQLGQLLQQLVQFSQQFSGELDHLKASKYYKLAQIQQQLQNQQKKNQQKSEQLSLLLSILHEVQQNTQLQAQQVNQQMNNEKEIINQLNSVNKEVQQQQAMLQQFQDNQQYNQYQQLNIELLAITQEIELYISQIQEHQNQIADFQDQINQLKEQQILAQQEKNDAQHRVSSQQNSKQQQLLSIKQLEHELIDLETQLGGLQQKFKQIVNTNRDQNEKLTNQLKATQQLVDINQEYLLIIEQLDSQKFQLLNNNFKLKRTNQLQLKYLIQYLIDSAIDDFAKLNAEDTNQNVKVILQLTKKSEQYVKQLNAEIQQLQQNNQQVTTSTANLEELQKSARQLIQMEQKLLQDKEKIINLIQKVDEKKTTALEELYESVNQHMGKIFNILLPNSFAQLEKVNEKEIGKGVQFKIQLGNTKTTLSGLSGGQKSLLALSFTLALLECKPSPIYILDEIDAALDLSHTHSIGKLIQQEFKGSQFIIVSLKEGMFNHANQLFKIKFVDGMSRVEAVK